MRIAFITFEYPPFIIGGAGVYAANLTQELVKLGNEVVVFTPKSDNPRTNEIDNLNIVEVKVNRRLPLVSVQFWMNLPKTLKAVHSTNRFDIVHINGTSYWFMPGKVIEVPHVVTIHHLSRDAKGDVSSGKSNAIQLMGESSVIYQYLESRCVRFADRIIAVSKFTRGRITEIYDISVEKIDVVYNGYTPLRTEISGDEIINFKKRFNLNSRPIILFVGRIDDPRKGLNVLLNAFSIISKKVDAQLLIVGKGDEETIILKAHKLGIDDMVTTTGFLSDDDLAISYSVCDLYVSPSNMEGFGLTLLEAMSYGKPIVATNVGSIPEIVTKDVVIVKPNDYLDLSISIVSFLVGNKKNNSIKYPQLTSYNWKYCAESTTSLYKNEL